MHSKKSENAREFFCAKFRCGETNPRDDIIIFTEIGCRIFYQPRSWTSFMNRHIVCAILFLTLAFSTEAQTENSIAPVNWERYKISNRNISIMLPKLPTVTEGSDACNEVEKFSYYAYAENAVYEFTVTAKSKERFPVYCQAKRKFGDVNLVERLAELRSDKMGTEEPSATKGERQIYKFINKDSTRWLFPDMAKSRWVELAITSRADAKSEEERFTSSLDLSGGDGKEIGSGSATMLGDAEVKPQAPSETKEAATTEALRIVAKPQARYTDAGRTNTVQGSVRLKVTLLVNGSVGTITPVTVLPHGLTEQAVFAARRIAFLPKTVNGVPVTTVVTIEYSFSIY